MIKEGKVIGGKFRIGKRIGGGSFGEIHLVYNVVTNEELAIKLEVVRKKKRSQLKAETQLYKLLQGVAGVPKIYGGGTEGDRNFLIMELLGPSLETLLRGCRHNISIPVCVYLMQQMICQIEQFHLRGYLHRDIKPDNFTMGKGPNAKTVFIIDYGLAKQFRDPKTKRHIPMREGKKLTGTARFASLNTHFGLEQSRRDDLECLGYTIMYLMKGQLPWQGIKGKTKNEKYNKIMDKKMNCTVQKLCENVPIEFSNYFYYVREMKFAEKPDYASLYKQFKDLFIRNRYNRDFQFDWDIIDNNVESSRKHKTEGSDGTNKAVSNENNLENQRNLQSPPCEEEKGISVQKSLPPKHFNPVVCIPLDLKKMQTKQITSSNVQPNGSMLPEQYFEKTKKVHPVLPLEPVTEDIKIERKTLGSETEEMPEIPSERPGGQPIEIPVFFQNNCIPCHILFETRLLQHS